MADIKNKAIKTVWASNTSNIVKPSSLDQKGIVFGAGIVSNQLNGALNSLSNQVAYSQYNGGMYSDDLTYNVGNVVHCFYDVGSGVQYGFFKCINDSGGAGINKIPPIENSTPQIQNGSVLLTGSAISKNWELVTQLPPYVSIKSDGTNPTAYDGAHYRNNIYYNLNSFLQNIKSTKNTYTLYTIPISIKNTAVKVTYKHAFYFTVTLSGNPQNELSMGNSFYYPDTKAPLQNNAVMQGTIGAISSTWLCELEYIYHNGLLSDIDFNFSKIGGSTLKDEILNYIPTILTQGCETSSCLGFLTSVPYKVNIKNGAYESLYNLSSNINKTNQKAHLICCFMNYTETKISKIEQTTPCPIVEWKNNDRLVNSNLHLARLYRISDKANRKGLDRVGEMAYFNKNKLPNGWYPLGAFIQFETQAFNGFNKFDYSSTWNKLSGNFGSLIAPTPLASVSRGENDYKIENALMYNGLNDIETVWPMIVQDLAKNNPYYAFSMRQPTNPMGLMLMDCANFIEKGNIIDLVSSNGNNGYYEDIYRLTLNSLHDRIVNNFDGLPTYGSGDNFGYGSTDSTIISSNDIFNPIIHSAQFASPPHITSVLCIKIF